MWNSSTAGLVLTSAWRKYDSVVFKADDSSVWLSSKFVCSVYLYTQLQCMSIYVKALTDRPMDSIQFCFKTLSTVECHHAVYVYFYTACSSVSFLTSLIESRSFASSYGLKWMAYTWMTQLLFGFSTVRTPPPKKLYENSLTSQK